jgi:hypothetical protein
MRDFADIFFFNRLLGWLFEKLPITVRVIGTHFGTAEAEIAIVNGFKLKLEENFFA